MLQGPYVDVWSYVVVDVCWCYELVYREWTSFGQYKSYVDIRNHNVHFKFRHQMRSKCILLFHILKYHIWPYNVYCVFMCQNAVLQCILLLATRLCWATRFLMFTYEFIMCVIVSYTDITLILCNKAWYVDILILNAPFGFICWHVVRISQCWLWVPMSS